MILALYIDADTSAQTLGRPLLLGVGAVALAYAIMALALRSIHRGALVTASLLIVLRAEGPEHVVVGTVLVALVAAAYAWSARIHRRPVTARRATPFANSVTALLLVAVAITGVANGRVVATAHDLLRSSPGEPGPATTDAPSVLVLMLDGYPRADTVERLLGKSNDPFLTGLRERGFQVADRSRSNYMYTSLTLSTMLHMRHIESIEGTAAGMRQVINDNPAFDMMRQRGYRVMTNAVPWVGVTLQSGDEYCGDGGVNDFEHHLLRSSLLMPIVETLNPSFLADRWRSYIDVAFDCSHEAATGAGAEQRLIFAHVPAPHLPIVYQRDGQPAPLRHYSDTRPELDITDAEFSDAYMSHLEYVNVRTLEVVDAMTSADRESIVVVLSDHGSEFGLNWLSGADSDLDERFANLFAARTPGVPCLFGSSPTPVNLFTSLLRGYFSQAIPLLPDSQFVSDSTSPLDVELLQSQERSRTGCNEEGTGS